MNIQQVARYDQITGMPGSVLSQRARRAPFGERISRSHDDVMPAADDHGLRASAMTLADDNHGIRNKDQFIAVVCLLTEQRRRDTGQTTFEFDYYYYYHLKRANY